VLIRDFERETMDIIKAKTPTPQPSAAAGAAQQDSSSTNASSSTGAATTTATAAASSASGVLGQKRGRDTGSSSADDSKATPQKISTPPMLQGPSAKRNKKQ